MSQEGANLPQDVQESHDRTISTTTNTPVRSPRTNNSNLSSNSDKSGKNNAGSKLTSPVVASVNVEIGDKGKNIVVVNDGEEEGGEGGGDSGSSAAGGFKSKNSSDGGEHELKGVVVSTDEEGTDDGDDNGRSSTDMDHELHIWTERERRKKMKNMYSSLHALLPQLSDKADKASIVGEAINYITTLQGTIEKLERMRAQLRSGGGSGRGRGEASTSALPRAAPAVAPATREAVLADMVQGWNAQQDAAAAGAGGSAAAPGAVTAPPPFQTWSRQNVVLSVAGGYAFITLSMPQRPDFFTTVLFVLEKHDIDVVTATVSSDQNGKLLNLQVRIKQVSGSSSHSSESLTPEDEYKLAVSEVMRWLSN